LQKTVPSLTDLFSVNWALKQTPEDVLLAHVVRHYIIIL